MQDAAGAAYAVGWIDAAARGAALGRGILETAEPIEGSFDQPPERARRVPVDFPAFVLNPVSVALFNEAYFRRVESEFIARLVQMPASVLSLGGGAFQYQATRELLLERVRSGGRAGAAA